MHTPETITIAYTHTHTRRTAPFRFGSHTHTNTLVCSLTNNCLHPIYTWAIRLLEGFFFPFDRTKRTLRTQFGSHQARVGTPGAGTRALYNTLDGTARRKTHASRQMKRASRSRRSVAGRNDAVNISRRRCKHHWYRLATVDAVEARNSRTHTHTLALARESSSRVYIDNICTKRPPSRPLTASRCARCITYTRVWVRVRVFVLVLGEQGGRRW